MMPKTPTEVTASKVKVQANISEGLFNQLKGLATREQRSISAVIAIAIRAYVEQGQTSLPL